MVLPKARFIGGDSDRARMDLHIPAVAMRNMQIDVFAGDSVVFDHGRPSELAVLQLAALQCRLPKI